MAPTLHRLRDGRPGGAPRAFASAPHAPESVTIAMIGAGYVGLVTAACLAEIGHKVAVVDKDARRVAELAAGRMPIHEPGLEELVEASVNLGRLAFTSDLAAAVSGADAVFLAVGTPPRPEDGRADLAFVHEATFALAPHLRPGAVVVVKSTVPVGTCDGIEDILRKLRPGAGLSVASNPEFLRAGAAVGDFMHPDRIVVGTAEPHARAVMAAIYRPLEDGGAPVVFIDRRSAELAKYAANAFLATKITFINEIADLCEAAGADVQDVARCMGLDRRIGPDFLRPGPGLGGSCFPKDTAALVRDGEERGIHLGIVSAVCGANERRKTAMAGRVVAALGGSAAGRTVAVLGLTFKPDTDDMREAPALAVVPALQAAGATVRAYDPKGMAAARRLLPGLVLARDPYDCAAGADALVIVTEWAEFRGLDLPRLRAVMARPVVVDLRNVYRPDEMRAAGFAYHSIGRPAVSPVEPPAVIAAPEPPRIAAGFEALPAKRAAGASG